MIDKICVIFMCLLITVLPLALDNIAYAESKAWDGSIDISWYDTDKNEFFIDTPAKLAGVAALVNGMTDVGIDDGKITGDKSLISGYTESNVQITGAAGGNVNATVYKSNIDFAGKTIYITKDLDMGGVKNSNDKWSGPNWTPIGGKYSMDVNKLDGDSLLLDTRFNGVLDGKGHKITNLYCDRYTDRGFAYSQCVGLVGYLGEGEFENGWQPAVKNLSLSGYVHARRMAGGIVGRIGETTSGTVVESCANHADVFSSDSKGIGGIVGSGWGDGVIRNCYNTGHVETTYACPAGGICGSNGGMDIYNCYNAGQISSNGNDRDRSIGGHDNGSYTVDNCFWLEGSASNGGYYTDNSQYITVNVTELSQAEMKDESFISKLNVNGDVFTVDNNSINNGYPILYFESDTYTDKTYTISVIQPEFGGTIYAPESANAAETVDFSAGAQPGYALDHYTVNGNKIPGDFYTVNSDITVSAVFRKLACVNLTVSDTQNCEIILTKNGLLDKDGKFEYAKNIPVKSNDKVYENDVITISVNVNKDIAPDDNSLEYTGDYSFALENGDKISPTEFTVTGAGNVRVEVTLGTQKKQWTTLADTSWYNENDDTFTIGTAKELAGLAFLVNNGTDSFYNKTVLLKNDISLEKDENGDTRYWKSIGSDAKHPFGGTFDGQSFCVSDINGSSDASYGGFFGYTAEAVIKNLKISGEYASSKNIIAGIAAFGQKTEISNCINEMNIQASNTAAGICAKATECVIRNCVNTGKITTQSNYSAGIAARCDSDTVISGCINKGEITGAYGVSGIVSEYSSEKTLYRCANEGNITATGGGKSDSNTAAGIVANLMSKAQIDECCNVGSIIGSVPTLGGIVGKVLKSNTVISNCYNRGDLTSLSESDKAVCAGIAGTCSGSIVIENCYNSGKTVFEKSTSEFIGQIYGKFADSEEVTNCFELFENVDFNLNEITSKLGKAFRTVDGEKYPELVWRTVPVSDTDTEPANNIQKGDADKNGEINMSDVVLIQRYLAKLTENGIISLYNADVNLDSEVNLQDVTQIQRFIAGLTEL